MKHFVARLRHNPALNLAPFSRWTLRDKAARRRLLRNKHLQFILYERNPDV